MHNCLTIPILYRCDEKYRFFLINSILSVLKHYKGSKMLHFYVCTNDNLDISYLDSFKKIYNFNYSILKIDSNFFKNYDSLKEKQHLAIKKYISFNFDDVVSDEYNGNTYQFNPFRRNKFIISSTLFFLAITNYEKVICLDSDTLVVSDICELYDTDISEFALATCVDWGENCTKFNPSVTVINVSLYKQIFYSDNGILARLEQLNDTKLPNTTPYCEAVQIILNETAGDSVKILDKAWNVPITHMHIYPEPKIYHFSESWTGNPHVLNTYNFIVNKYLKDEQYKYSKS